MKILMIITLGIVIIILGAGVMIVRGETTTSEVQVTKCNSLDGDIEKSANCLRDELKTFYNYNISNLRKHVTEEELMEEGAVCWQYSNWYKEKMEELGYYVKEVTIDMGEYRHKFAIASSDDSKYCLLDQTNEIHCVQMGNPYA